VVWVWDQHGEVEQVQVYKRDMDPEFDARRVTLSDVPANATVGVKPAVGSLMGWDWARVEVP